MIPRRDTMRECLGITVAGIIFWALMWGLYEIGQLI